MSASERTYISLVSGSASPLHSDLVLTLRNCLPVISQNFSNPPTIPLASYSWLVWQEFTTIELIGRSDLVRILLILNKVYAKPSYSCIQISWTPFSATYATVILSANVSIFGIILLMFPYLETLAATHRHENSAGMSSDLCQSALY